VGDVTIEVAPASADKRPPGMLDAMCCGEMCGVQADNPSAGPAAADAAARAEGAPVDIPVAYVTRMIDELDADGDGESARAPLARRAARLRGRSEWWLTRRVPAWRDDDAFECSHAAAAHTTAIFSRSFLIATGEISLDEFLVAVCADEVAVAPPAPPPTVASVIAALDEAVAPKAAAPPETAEVAAEAAPADEEEEAAESYFHRLSPPSGEGAAALVYYALTLPFALAFALTVPDCEHPAVLFGKRAHWVSFFMSILWSSKWMVESIPSL
jgi:hypothetical protein